MSREPHAAFPSVASLTASSSVASTSTPLPTLPKTAEDVRNLITGGSHPDYVADAVLPTLEAMWRKCDGGAGNKHEAALAMVEEKLEGLSDEDLHAHTGGLVYVLLARMNIAARSSKADVDLFNLCARLALNANEHQLRLCSVRVSLFAQKFLQLAKQCKKTDVSLQPLWSLVTKAVNRFCLSGICTVYLEACLLTRSFDKALPLVNDTYTDVHSCQPTYLDIISFYHHAGLIAAALQRYSLAKEHLTIAVSVPTHTVSAIQLAAAKRAILCGILDNGKHIHFPKYTSGTVTRAIDKQAQAYVKLAQAFEARNWDSVKEASKAKIFVEDCNGGLVKQVLASVTKRRILKVRETYSRLTLEQLAEKVGSKDDSALVSEIRTMITTQSIPATITGTSPEIVTFIDDDAQNDLDTLPRLEELKVLASWIERELTRGNEALGVDKRYLQKQANNLEITGGKGSGKTGRMDEFEELMTAEEAAGGPGGGGRGFKRGAGGRVGNDFEDTGF